MANRYIGLLNDTNLIKLEVKLNIKRIFFSYFC